MTLEETIRDAEQILPSVVAADGELDPRWQAIIAVAEFVETNPNQLWDFARRWGADPDPDLRQAVATCLLEHLLQYHFAELFPLVARAAREDALFADTVLSCWAFGETEQPKHAA